MLSNLKLSFIEIDYSNDFILVYLDLYIIDTILMYIYLSNGIVRQTWRPIGWSLIFMNDST